MPRPHTHDTYEIQGDDLVNYYTYFDSPLQPLLLTSDSTALTGLFMVAHRHGPEVEADWIQSDEAAPFAEAKRQLAAYFAVARWRSAY